MLYVLETAIDTRDGEAVARCWAVADEGEFVRVVDLYRMASGGILGALGFDPAHPQTPTFEQAVTVNSEALLRHEILPGIAEAVAFVRPPWGGRIAKREAWAVLDAVGDGEEFESLVDDLRASLRRDAKGEGSGNPFGELGVALQCLAASMWGREPAMSRPDYAAGAESAARIAAALSVKFGH